MNVELLQQVKAYILAEPRRLNMGVVMTHSDSAPCGSAGCIDGWAQFLVAKGKLKASVKPFEFVPTYDPNYLDGREALDLDYRQAERLFTPPGERGDYAQWPEDLANCYLEASSDKERASITAERIDRFIASNGEE